MLLVGCGSHTVNYEPYSPLPITVDCAFDAIKQMKKFDFVEKSENQITFYNKSYGGSLYHGGAGEFTQYGLELSTTRPLGPDLDDVFERLINNVNKYCVEQNSN